MSENFSLKVTASSIPYGDTKKSCPLNKSLDAIRRFRASSEPTLSLYEVETIKEIETRVLRLMNQYQELLNINARLMDTDPLRPRISFDSSSDVLKIGIGDRTVQLKLNRADPKIPLSLSGFGAVGAYIPGLNPGEPEEVVQLKSRMEPLLEGFYQSAHRLLKIIKDLSRFNKVESRLITMVRNKLVEHPKVGDFYTFGWSTDGPVMRPIHRPDREWVDAGLVPNTQEFADVLTKAFEERAG